MLTARIPRAAHDELGYNGSNQTYMIIHRLCYWKGLKISVKKHIKQCMACQKRNIQVVKYAQLHFPTPKLQMQFILIDLSGSFDPSSGGYCYTFMLTCMSTGYTFCIPLKTKTPSEVVQAYIDEVYAKFGRSVKILFNNETEFNNQLFTNMATQLGAECRIYTPPYHPQSNRRTEGFHKFLKACMSKHVSKIS